MLGTVTTEPSNSPPLYRRFLVLLYIFGALTLLLIAHGADGFSKSSADLVKGATDSEGIHEAHGFVDSQRTVTMTEDITASDARTAIVMPCTVMDAITTLPMALKSAGESTDPAHETIIVFGMTKTLEETIHEVLPAGVSAEIDSIRDHLRNFFVRWTRLTPQSGASLSESRSKNRLTPDSSITPQEIFKGLRMAEFLQQKRSENPDGPWIDLPPTLRYAENLIDFYDGYETLNKLASDLNNFHILLNITPEPWANSSRQVGFYDAFQENNGHALDNDIVSFIDCDDISMPARVQWIQQVFKENPDVQHFIHTGRKMDMTLEKDKMFPEAEQDAEFLPAVDKPPETVEDITAWRETFYSKYLDFRDPEVKAKYVDRQRSEAFLTNKNGEIMEDARDLSKHNLVIDGNTHADFSWWFGCTDDATISDQKNHLQWLNGHQSFRHQWLLNEMHYFPNCLIGEDARLSYSSIKKGGIAMSIPLPLSVYVRPQGPVKRGLLKDLIQWNADQQTER